MEPIEHLRISKGMTVFQFINELGKTSFNGRELFRAVEIFREMKEDRKCWVFATLAGALIPGGLKYVIYDLLKDNLINALVTTGAIVTHDLIEFFGERHFYGGLEKSDEDLYDENINRIYTSYLPNIGYEIFEEKIRVYLEKLPKKTFSPSQFLFELGRVMEGECLLSIAFEKNIPIFCPCIGDSVLGFHAWMYSQGKNPILNPLLDQKGILDIVWGEKKIGALIVGGGVPKHYLAMAAQMSGKGLSYAIQITLDRPEHGGVSGAPLSEAISWGKVAKGAKIANIISDATIALPLLVAGVKG
ncbi:MAG: deoxyhypusine synthase family protein [Candidatus Syntropharchaeia archaeon]